MQSSRITRRSWLRLAATVAESSRAIDHTRRGSRPLSADVRLAGGFGLSPDGRAAVLAFLDSLTDEQFVRDPRFSDPFAPAAGQRAP